MLMTKEQAEQAWCPMSRVNVVFVIDAQVPAAAACKGPSCAMWRWDGKVKIPAQRDRTTFWPKEDFAEVEPTPRPAKVPAHAVWVPLTGEGDDMDGGYWVEPQEVVDAEYADELARIMDTARGYCGLAGRPA